MLTLSAMVAFAGNSILCRLALKDTEIDAASFTSLRLVSGAVMLWLIVGLPRRKAWLSALNLSRWPSALALFVYAVAFSYAYTRLSTGTGALLLFGAVQTSMIGFGLYVGERLGGWQVLGSLLAFAGLLTLVFPGVSSPSLVGCLLMLVAGVAWGIYSLLGRKSSAPAEDTMHNFILTLPLAALLCLPAWSQQTLDHRGVLFACVSGAIASGLGYVIWYMALGGLQNTTAAIVQLSVPVIAAAGGVLFLDEVITLRLFVASLATLAGIAIVVLAKKSSPGPSSKTEEAV
ncbi:MAG: DMT family transporter [bacterium]|nr:DMT family transporter [bacterium]